MIKKNWFNLILIFTGLALVLYSFYLTNTIPREQIGVMSGIGSGLFAVGLACIIANIYNKHNPKAAKWKNIQVNDERNTFLRYKSNNMVQSVNQWLLFALAMITILAKLPLWLTLSLVAINLIDWFLYIFFFNKYNKEM